MKGVIIKFLFHVLAASPASARKAKRNIINNIYIQYEKNVQRIIIGADECMNCMDENLLCV